VTGGDRGPGDGRAGARPAPAPRAVHQFVPALIPRDATGSHTLLLRQALRDAGWRSEIYAEATHDELLGESIRVEDYPAQAAPGDVLIYQFSTSSMVAELLAERPEPLVIDYHNVTHPDLYGEWDPVSAKRSADALSQLALLAPRSALGLADSEFNRADLEAAGCRRTAVVPVLVDLERLAAPPDPRVSAQLVAAKGGGGADWLFVGRLVPSKAQHDLVKALWAYRQLYDPRARLHLVGPTPSSRYLASLRAFVADLGLIEAVRITGEVSDDALAAHFLHADVYVSLSVHEGFGVPLLEAMRASVPVVALSAGAVPDTVGSAALLLDRVEPSLVAAAVHRLLGDAELRSHLVAEGRQRAGGHTLAGSGVRAVEAIVTVAGPPPVKGSSAQGVPAQGVQAQRAPERRGGSAR
jgi:glycosyltransferase involved in cell wall biosynthesis